jgi:hypothetical protein
MTTWVFTQQQQPLHTPRRMACGRGLGVLGAHTGKGGERAGGKQGPVLSSGGKGGKRHSLAWRLSSVIILTQLSLFPRPARSSKMIQQAGTVLLWAGVRFSGIMYVFGYLYSLSGGGQWRGEPSCEVGHVCVADVGAEIVRQPVWHW